MKKGSIVKVIYRRDGKGKRIMNGKITALTKDLMCIKFKNYIESFRVIDILCEDEWVEVQVLQDKKWIPVNKSNIDDIENNKILKHILKTRFLDI